MDNRISREPKEIHNTSFSSDMGKEVSEKGILKGISHIGEKIWPGLLIVGVSIAAKKISPRLLNRFAPKFRVSIGGGPPVPKMPKVTHDIFQEISIKSNQEVLEKHGIEPLVKESSKKSWEKIVENHSFTNELTASKKNKLIKEQKLELQNIHGDKWKSVYKSNQKLKSPAELSYLKFEQTRRRHLIKESETKIFENDWKGSAQKLPGWKKTIAKIEENQKNLINKNQELIKQYEKDIQKNTEAVIEHVLTAATTALFYTGVNYKNATENDFSKYLNQNVNELKAGKFKESAELQMNRVGVQLAEEMEKIQATIQGLPDDLKQGMETVLTEFNQAVKEKLENTQENLNHLLEQLKALPTLDEHSEVIRVLKSLGSESAVVLAALLGRSFLIRKLINKIPLQKLMHLKLDPKMIEVIGLGLTSVVLSSAAKTITSQSVSNLNAEEVLETFRANMGLENGEKGKDEDLIPSEYTGMLAESFSTIVSSFVSHPVLSDIINIVLSAVMETSLSSVTDQNLSKEELKEKIKGEIEQIVSHIDKEIEGLGKEEVASFKALSEKVTNYSTILKNEQQLAMEIPSAEDKNIANPSYNSFFDKESMLSFGRSDPLLKPMLERNPVQLSEKTEEIIAQVVIGVLMVMDMLSKMIKK